MKVVIREVGLRVKLLAVNKSLRLKRRSVCDINPLKIVVFYELISSIIGKKKKKIKNGNFTLDTWTFIQFGKSLQILKPLNLDLWIFNCNQFKLLPSNFKY